MQGTKRSVLVSHTLLSVVDHAAWSLLQFGKLHDKEKAKLQESQQTEMERLLEMQGKVMIMSSFYTVPHY